MNSIVRLPKLCFFIALVLFTLTTHVDAQQLDSNVDLKTINVDDMSDAQIITYIQKAESRGLSEAELTQLARQRGMPESQILKLKNRIREIRLKGPVQAGTSAQVNPQVENVESPPFGETTRAEPAPLTQEERRVFGINLFRRANVSFAPSLNLPTPVDYILGPGDEVIVDLWGDTQQLLRFVVSNEGTIKPDRLGPVYVNGYTIEAAEQKIIQKLSQIYGGLKGKTEDRTIFHQVSLGQIRTINIEIVGAVEQPGIYSLPSLATAYYALYSSGGPSSLGTFRDISLVRNGKKHATIDVYSFLTTGIKSGDERLKDGDVIVVPPYQTRVHLDGEVKVPASFELKSGETLQKLLEYASGFTDKAYKSLITVKRNGNKQRELIDVPFDDFESFMPENGDIVEVGKILNKFSNRVAISGAVYRQGEFELTEGMTVKELVEKAEGVRGDAFLERATIYRSEEDYSQSIISVDLKAVLSGAVADVNLRKDDLLVINSIYNLKEEYFVQVSGEVQQQGIYPFFNKMTVQDLVVLAGGFKESASKTEIEISRRNNSNDPSKASEIILINSDQTLTAEVSGTPIMPFDQVFVRRAVGYSQQETITIEGEVKVPGVYGIGDKSERISDILERAKGLTSYAFANGAILIRRTEFNSDAEISSIDLESLEELRNKILSNESELKGAERSALLGRIDKLKAIGGISSNSDVQGGELKRDLIQNSDTLGVTTSLGGREPVALRLDKIIEEPGGKYDLIVRPGDIISVPAKLQTVRIAGEVTSPLNFRYDGEYSFIDYINRSGGFLQSAHKRRSYIQYPNGERRGVKSFLFFKKYPKVEPGSTIVIARKAERNPVNVQAVIAAAGSVATLLLVIDRLGN